MSSQHAIDKEKYWGLSVPEGLKHGQKSWARKAYGCDCSACLPSGRRKWHNREGETGPKSRTVRGRDLKASKRGKPVPPTVKHGVYAYQVYLCRCEICRAAKSKTVPHWTTRARGRYSEVVDADGASTTIRCWPPADAGPDWTCPHPSHQKEAV